MVASVVAAVATTLAAVFLIPQIVRLIRFNDSAGVSPVWAAFGMLTNSAWILYLGASDLWLAAAAPALAAATYGITLAVLASLDRRRYWMWIATFYGIALVAVGGLGDMRSFGLVLSITPAVQLAPQILSVFRAASPTGVSPSTWTLSIGEAMLWGIYGTIVGDAALLGYGLVTSVGSTLVLGRVLVTCQANRMAVAAQDIDLRAIRSAATGAR